MPITKSAKKKLRKDKKRRKLNLIYKKNYKEIIKKSRKNPTKAEFLKEAYSKIDKTAKKGIIHKNKAARLKAKVAKLLAKNK